MVASSIYFSYSIYFVKQLFNYKSLKREHFNFI